MKSLAFLLTSAVILVLTLMAGGNSRTAFNEELALTQAAATAASINPFQELTFEAKAVYVYDLKAGKIIFSKQAESQLPLASLAKLITVALTLDSADNQNETVYLDSRALESEGEDGLIAGDRWRLFDLAVFGLVGSSNDATVALAQFSETKTGLSWQELAGQLAVRLNLHQTYLLNPTGLDLSVTVAGAYGSAKDIAAVLIYLYQKYPSLVEKTSWPEITLESLSGRQYKIANTNPLVANWPLLVASKTGLTDLAGGNLAIIFEAGPARPIISIVLGSTIEGRFTDSQIIMGAVFKYLDI